MENKNINEFPKIITVRFVFRNKSCAYVATILNENGLPKKVIEDIIAESVMRRLEYIEDINGYLTYKECSRFVQDCMTDSKTACIAKLYITVELHPEAKRDVIITI